MDPVTALGVAVGAIQLAGQVLKVTVAITRFYSEIREAPETVHKQLVHTNQLSGIARLVIRNAALQTKSVESVLQTCLQLISTIEKELSKVSVDAYDRTVQKLRNSFLAVMRKEKYVKLYDDLEREKVSLILCIQVADSSVLHTIGISVQTNKDTLTEISYQINDTALDVKTIASAIPALSKASEDTNLAMLTLNSKVSSIFGELPTITSHLAAIRTELQQLTSQPQLPRQPSGNAESTIKGYFKVPNRLSESFVGRQDVLDAMNRVLLSPLDSGFTVAVIRGMGGQGKTQIALQFCKLKRNNPFSMIFWVDATSEATLKSSFENIFETIKAPDLVLPSTDAKVEHVIDYLSRATALWLIVFDNYDKVDYRVQDYFTDNDTGSIIVTSRNAVTRDLVSDEDGYIDLHGLEENAALELLFRKSAVRRTDSMRPVAKEIVERLGYHPLAITQAASYVKKQRLGLNQFMDHYNSRRLIVLNATPALTEYRRKLGDADKEIALNVFTTWELSFQQLQESTSEDSVEVKLMTLLSFFDNQDITEMIMCHFDGRFWHDYLEEDSKQHLQWLDHFKSDGRWDTNIFCDAVVALSEISLVQSWQRQDDGLVHVTVHPLIRDWIRLRTSLKICQSNAITAWLLQASVFNEKWKNENKAYEMSIAAQQEMVRHVLLQLKNDKEYLLHESAYVSQAAALDAHKAQYECGFFIREMGQYTLSKKIFNRVVDYFKLHSHAAGDWLDWAMENLGSILIELGEFEAARDVFEDLLRTQTAILGPGDPQTIRTATRFTDAQSRSGQPEAAETLLRDLLRRSETDLGSSHTVIVHICYSLALALNARQMYGEAEVLYRRAWLGTAEGHGVDNANTLIRLTNLANSIANQARHDEALELYDQALAGFNKTLGPQHPSTIWCKEKLKDCLSQREGSRLRMTIKADRSYEDQMHEDE